MASKKEGEKQGGRRLVVIDGANAIFRAFFAIPGLRAPDGTPTNAALGFINILSRVIEDEKPDFVAVAMDPPGGSFRNEMYPDYKANRDATPEDLRVQFPMIKELVAAHNIALLEVPGFEADDVIASLVAAAPDDVDVSIISTDKDLMQLCTDRVQLVDGIKDRRFGPAEVEEKFGVPPEQLLDLRALVGDPSDNIPGVKGIGVKGAAKLIQEFGDLENLLAHAEEVKAKRAREGLIELAEEARLSKRLSVLREDVKLGVEFNDLAVKDADSSRLRELYSGFGFTRLLETLDSGGEMGGAASVSEAPDTLIIDETKALAACLADLKGEDALALWLVADAGSLVDAPIVGLALATRDGRSVYLPVAGAAEPQGDLLALDSSEEGASGIALADVTARISKLFGKKSAPAWFGWGVKRIQGLLAEAGVELPPPDFDLEIASFLLNPSGPHDLPALAQQWLMRPIRSWQDLAGKGAKAQRAGALAQADLAGWLHESLNSMFELRDALTKKIVEDGLVSLLEEVEIPLTTVLAGVERNGVRVDEGMLSSLSAEYETKLAQLEEEIYELAGEHFLVSSPKQLQVILFEKLKLPPLKKTKTGYSTAESVLEELAAQHELPGRILAWRQLSKLKSTYLDALPKLVSESTGRIHPSFNQIGAATGRLSASDPNVQNIPIRTEEGIRIREAFIPADGMTMLSADYSQVELRIMAHYSEDESLLDAFARGEDIHRRTAAEVAGIEVAEVTDDQRSHAKAVNFGIIYGSSAFGLATNLHIATSEAQEIVDAYFARYQGVRRFLDETIVGAKEKGYVSTFLGRRRYLPDLSSKNRVMRHAAERMAVNTVIQGTAADLIKKAMVDVDRELTKSKLGAKMIMQVHDELVFEVAKDEIKPLEEILHEKMEGVFELRVPLIIETGLGKNWREAH